MSNLKLHVHSAEPITPNQIRIATESFEQSAANIEECATKYGYDTWRVRVMDAQRASVNFVNSVGKTASQMEAATLLHQANGYSFSTAHNAPLGDKTAKIVTPYSVSVERDKDTPLRKQTAQLFYESEPIRVFESFRLYDIMSAVSPWYLERREYDGTPLPEKVFVNRNPFRVCRIVAQHDEGQSREAGYCDGGPCLDPVGRARNYADHVADVSFPLHDAPIASCRAITILPWPCRGG